MSKGKQHEAEASERARRATAEASASWALVGTGRWSARRKVSVVIEVLKGESLESLSRRHGVTAAKLSQWRDDFVAGGEARLKHREVTSRARTRGRSSASWRISPPTRRCWPRRFDTWRPAALWAGGGRSDASRDFALHPPAVRHRPRHARVAGAALDGLRATVTGAPGRRRWPSADPSRPSRMRALTAAVRAVIAASPFHGEGHRKIWARLRVQGLRTSKRRTLVVMRAADLLGPAAASPRRSPPVPTTAPSSPPVPT